MRRLLSPILDLDRTAKLLVAAIWLVGVVQGFAQSHATNTLPFSRLALGLTEGEMAGIMALTRIGAFTAVIFSFIADRRGRKPLFVTMLTLMILSSAATAWVRTAAEFTVTQGVMRAASTAAGVLGVVIIAESLPGTTRALGMGIYAAAASLGAGMSVLLLPVAEASADGWRVVFQYSLIGLLVVPVAMRYIPESRPVSQRRFAIWRPLVTPYAAHFWILALASFLFAAFTTVQVTFASERLINDLGYAAADVVVLTLSAGTLGGLGYFVGGHLADTRGRRLVTMVGFGIAAVGGVGIYWVEPLPLLGVAVFLSSLGAFSAAPATAAHRNELFPSPIRASAVSWLAAFTVTGTIGGLWIGSRTIDQIGLSATVLLLGGGMLIAIAVTAALPETRVQRATTEAPALE